MLTSRNRGSLAFSIAAALVVVGGCSYARDDQTGDGTADHTTGQPVALNNPYVWAKLADADFGVGLSSPSGSAAKPAAMNDVATVRINQWLDRYHSLVGDVLREHGQTLVAPKPSAALLKEYGPNAWVSPAIACPTGWTLRPSGGSFGGAPANNLLLTSDYVYGMDGTDSCVSPENWTDKSSFASFFNSQNGACRVGLEADELAVSGEACTFYGSTAPLATYAVSSTIAVTLDAITWGSESRVADTLAHELGHYYRAHANPTVRKQIDFFYRDEPNGPDRPVAAAESASYEKIINQLRGLATPIRLKSPTRYNTRLAGALYNLRSLCSSATIDENVLRALEGGQVTASNKSAYLAFENAMASCGANVSIANPTTRDQITKVLRSSRVYLQIAPNAATLDDALKGLTTDLDQLDSQEAALAAKLGSGMFGWYTEEQEADEICLELAARAGIDPKDVIADNVRTYEQLDALYARAGVDRGDEVTMVTCKQWLAAGFTEKAADGTTQPVRVPVGSISDNHHDGCYRIYNMWRESKRHQYVVAPPLPALTPTWDSIQAHALTLGGTKPPPTVTKPGSSSSSSSSSGSDPSGGDSGGSDEGTEDPEGSAPPPRRPRQPSNGATEESTDAGVTTVTKTTSACAQTPGPSGGMSAFSLAAVALFALAFRRRRA